MRAGLELALLGHVLWASWRKEGDRLRGAGRLVNWESADWVDTAGGLSVTALRDLPVSSLSPHHALA